MTINREAAELMALRLTNAVDAAHTLAEALRLATVALQEPREVPEVEPGTKGTFRGLPAVVAGHGRVVAINPAYADQPTDGIESYRLDGGFVPDPDAAALRAEVERLTQKKAEVIANANILEGQRRRGIEDKAEILRDRDGHRRRADAAEARLAGVTALLDAPGEDASCAGLDLTTPGCFAHDLAARIRALVAADEQAAEGEVTRETLEAAWSKRQPQPADAGLTMPSDPLTAEQTCGGGCS